jgi:phosphoglycolate phosphatase-like HAD superfamily hydrolase
MPVYFDYLGQEIENAGQNYKLHIGVRELIDELSTYQRICLGLLTGNVERGARMKLAPFGLNEYFPIGAFGCDSASRLELPAVAQQRGKSYYDIDFKPEDIIIIGDSIHDVRCANHYGAISVAVTTGRTTKEELMQENPDYLVDNLVSRSWFDSLNI